MMRNSYGGAPLIHGPNLKLKLKLKLNLEISKSQSQYAPGIFLNKK